MNKRSLLIAILVITAISTISGGTMYYRNNKENSLEKAVNNELTQNDSLTADNNVSTQNNTIENETTESKISKNETKTTTKSEQTGTAGSNMPLKDNQEKAKSQIEIAMKNLIKETYGDEVVDSKINMTKVYTPQEEQQNDALKEQNLGPNEVAFEVNYELKIADRVTDIIKYTAGSGNYNDKTRWVTDKFNVGILRPDGNGYKITDFGTGW